MSNVEVDESQPSRDEGRYQVVATLERGEVVVKSCGSMTEAILYRFDVEATVIRAGFTCPPMKVEMRGPAAA